MRWFGMLVGSIFNLVINILPNKKLLNYSIKEQLMDVLPAFVLSFFMGIIVYFTGYLYLSVYIKLFIQVITGIILYISFALIFKLEPFFYILQLVKDYYIKYKKGNSL